MFQASSVPHVLLALTCEERTSKMKMLPLCILNSIKLDSRNKERMHNFYDVLLKRFRRVGGQAGDLPAERQDRQKQLDFLTGCERTFACDSHGTLAPASKCFPRRFLLPRRISKPMLTALAFWTLVLESIYLCIQINLQRDRGNA